jgi:hypothetical protein
MRLRSIRFSPHSRADVRTMRRIQDETTEELRDQIDRINPLLHWPIIKGENHGSSSASGS